MRSAHEWLKDPDRVYADGVEILRSKQPKEAAFFETVKNPDAGSYHYRMLFSKLENIARKELQNPTAKKEESAVKSIIRVNEILHPSKPKKINSGAGKSDSLRITSNPTVEYKALPEDLQIKYMRNREITRLKAQKQQELKSAKSDESRKQLVEILTSLEKEGKANWKAIDDWWTKNKPLLEPSEQEKIAQAALVKAREIENIKINISRTKKELDKLPDDKKAKKLEKIANWEKKLSELQK